jgi:hypothetical protein
MMRMMMLSVAAVLAMSGTALAGDPVSPESTPAVSPSSTQKTCGQQMRERAALPAKVSELLTANADNFQDHAKWVAKSGHDKASKAEVAALEKLVTHERKLAVMFASLASEMIGMGDLAGAAHDPNHMDRDAATAIWQRQATLDREVAAMLVKEASELDDMIAANKKSAKK